jgi:hypothetical protein
MTYTNNFNLPRTLAMAVERDDYSKGDARISVTGLITPPQIAVLREKYAEDIVTDVSDNIWRIVGTAIHALLERAGDELHIPEERLFADILGWRVSGGIDLQMLPSGGVDIRDYKFTGTYSIRSEKADWVAQLNSYAFLVREAKGLEVNSLGVVVLLRDWMRSKTKYQDYPQAPVQNVRIPMWTHDQCREYLEGRIRLHREALRAAEWEEDLPPCTDEERWVRPGGWAIMRPGGKRARKICSTESEALSSSRGDEVIEERPPEYVRCTGNYCHVSRWCKQFTEELTRNHPK